MSTQATGDIGFRTAGYVAADLLKRAAQDLVLQPFGQAKPIPKNVSETILFRRYEALAAAITALTEGVTPNGSAITKTDYSATLSQYGDWVGITDVVQDTHEDPIIREYSDILAQQAAETVETVLFNILKAGTNLYRANGSARTDINTPLTRTLVDKVIRGFKRQNAKVITKKVSSSASFNTESVKPAFIFICHPDLQNTVENLQGFKNVVDYGGGMTAYPTEIGAVGEARFLTSTVIASFPDAGGTKAGSGTTMISTTGTSADVYPILALAANWFGVTPLKGANALTPFVHNPQVSDSDKLGQRGHIGWKTYFTACILNQLWGARIEVSVPEL
jgi:N4-gp56 family major capsid protein